MTSTITDTTTGTSSKFAAEMQSESAAADLNNENLFNNIKYICSATPLITESLQKGFNVAQMPNGDVIITEIRIVNVQYSWDESKQKMVKIGQN